MVVLLGQDAMTGARRREKPELPGWTSVYREYQSSALSQIFKYVGKKKSILPLENPLGRGSQPAVACRDIWTWVAHPKCQKYILQNHSVKCTTLGAVTGHCGKLWSTLGSHSPSSHPSIPALLSLFTYGGCTGTRILHSWCKVLRKFNPAEWIPPFPHSLWLFGNQEAAVSCAGSTATNMFSSQFTHKAWVPRGNSSPSWQL